MEVLALALAAVLALGCVVFVARPFLREPEAVDDRIRVAGTGEQERIRLEEERDRALAALKELEFDHRTGKISDTDYRESVGTLRSAGRPGTPGSRCPGPSSGRTQQGR